MSSKSKYKSGKGVGGYIDARVNGIESHSAKSWSVDGKQTPRNVLTRRLKRLRKHVDKVDALTAELEEARKERDAAILGEKKLLHDLDPAIRAGVGNSAKALAPFGMEPTKARAPLSPEDRLIAKARAAETRAGLGTRGKRQRQAKLDELRGKPQVKVVDPKASNPPAPPAVPEAPANTASFAPARNTVVPPADGQSPLDGASPDGVHA